MLYARITSYWKSLAIISHPLVLLLNVQIKSDNGSPVTSYVLQWDKGEADGQFETIYDGSQKQYKCNQKFPPKTTYRFRVKAINKIGERYCTFMYCIFNQNCIKMAIKLFLCNVFIGMSNINYLLTKARSLR